MTEEQQQKEEKTKVQESSKLPNLAKLLAGLDNSPTSEDIENWKQEFGEIYCSGFDEDELFVWRPLSRGEHVDIQKTLRSPVQEEMEPFTEFDMEEMVVSRCILWSSKPSSLQNKAGGISTLSEQIMMNSNFMPTQMAATLVIKL